jgi:hypothetical protein
VTAARYAVLTSGSLQSATQSVADTINAAMPDSS